MIWMDTRGIIADAKRGVKMGSKSQTFSMDMMIAIGIFIIGIVVLLYLIVGNSSNVSEKLATDSEILPQRLMASDEMSATNNTFVVQNKVDLSRLNKTLSKDYDELKKELDISSDFCIHFEDENGNLVNLDPDPGYLTYSIGSPKLTIIVKDSWCTRTISCGVREQIPPATCP
jgi:hypothetical protein